MDNIIKLKILVVDADQANSIAVKSALKNLYLEIVFAHSTREALRLLLEHDFLVILLNVQTPEGEGFEIARLIRAREKSSRTPIIFLNAWHASEIDVIKFYALEATDYLLKPLDPATLRCKVKVFIDLYIKSVLVNYLQEELNKQRAISTLKPYVNYWNPT